MTRRGPHRLTLFLGAVFVLGACAGAPKPAQKPAIEPGAQDQAREAPAGPVAPSPKAKPAINEGDEGDTAETKRGEFEDKPSGIDLPRPKDVEIAAVPTHAPIDLPGPGDLIGLSAGEVRDLMGAPVFRRRDPPAELWQYSSKRCFFDVFLFQGKGAPAYRVNHIEARGRTISAIPLRECFLSLKKPGKG